MNVAELIRRATGVMRLDHRVVFRPSLVYPVLHDPFWVWCEYHAPRSEAVDETGRYDEMRWQRGREHEQAWVRAHYPEAVLIKPEFGLEALKNTLQAMLRGVPAIHQPQLWNLGGESYGKGDLLVQDESHGSDLGPYHYRPVEVKWARSLQEHHVIQAACYNRMLGRLQGYTPGTLTIALREGVERVPYSGTERELDAVLSTWRALRDGRLTPEPGRPPNATDSPWRVYGNKVVQGRMDLVLLAEVGSRDREKLREAGIHRVDQLWERRLEEVCEILGAQAGTTAYHVAQAYKTGQPVRRPGGRLAIPRAERHLYFDFETSDEVHPTEPPHIYLIGCWDAERDRSVRFLAGGAKDEARIFQEFLEYIGDVEKTRLYHWTDFEIRELRKVIERWPVLEGSLTRLTASCVDLKETVKAAVYLPVPTFSLKCVAPALGFQWHQEGFGAFEAMVCYWDFLGSGDESALDQAIRYNEDDCRAMQHVDRELTKRLA